MEATDEPALSEVFMAICDLHGALGVEPLNKLPGAWEHKVDERWQIAVNGTQAAIRVILPGCMNCTLEPYHAAIWFNGWLAGILSPSAGVLAAGTEANEETLLAALRAATEKAGQPA